MIDNTELRIYPKGVDSNYKLHRRAGRGKGLRVINAQHTTDGGLQLGSSPLVRSEDGGDVRG